MTTRLWAQREKKASSTPCQIVTMHLLKWRFPLTELPSTFKRQVDSTNSSPRYQLTLWTSTTSRAIFLDNFSPLPKCVYLVPLNSIPHLNSKLSKLARYKHRYFFLACKIIFHLLLLLSLYIHLPWRHRDEVHIRISHSSYDTKQFVPVNSPE